ncbi:DUF2142 domain-containing protein [Solirubrobacter sp. CPCC 204708]|uniref:DUF2142 domain-containing protein n=1 Tax=Solirubrobacter deserti TaxID=2282478 RepID=A0ABT4RN54_9ACTN|nr:DUF2142 domain-containing protein [Solirubrobacter deserti]MBE2317409.1 DUF2142 domain-containing protein [Solirubrobacter deserti]MDA0139991.1 DUF2142 domain-containing protein [Solirubrobacter deserti]
MSESITQTDPSPSRRRRVPGALAALLAATAILGVAWALILPGWQAPDENSHYGYVQSLVDGPGLPGEPDRPLFATEQSRAADAVNADQTAASLVTRPEWSRTAFERWREAERELPDAQRSDGGGQNAARSNPPLAYLLYAAPYAAAGGGGVFDRLVWMRIVGVVWLLVTVAATWALAGEVFGRRPLFQLAAAALPALAPMPTFISASVTPDGLLFALWTVALWLGVRMLRRGLTVRSGVAFMAVVGLACWVKATSYALVPGALLAFAIAAWRVPGGRARVALPGLAALVAVVGGWLVTARILARPASQQLTSAATASGLDVRELGSYLWQFYLPKLWFMQDFFPSVPMGLPVVDVILNGAWARFGWLEIEFPGWVYWALTVLTLAVAVAAAVAVWRARTTLDRGVLAFLALVALTLVAGLHWQEYQLKLSSGAPFMQGRYVLPLIGIAGLASAAALRLVSARLRGLTLAGMVGGLFALQAFSLALTLERFYA